MFTQLRNLADIAAVLSTPTTIGTPNTFGMHTPKSTIAEPGTPSNMDISSSINNSPSPLLFHIDLQDDQKKFSPIPIPVQLPPIDDLFKHNHKPQLARKSVPFTKPPCPMQEIWAERAAQEAAEEEDGKREVTVIVSNDNDRHTLDWSLSPHLTT